MILFQKDWFKYGSAIADYDTNNTSWVRLAGIFSSMGIQNHSFHLALHNPALKGIDPYDSNLTMEQMTMIAIECKENPWYFFREVLRVPTPGAKDNINIRANRENISVWWLFFNHITSIVIAPRQTGKSVTIFGLDTYLLGVAGVSLDIHLLTKDDDLRMKSVSNIKEMLEDLPPYLKLKSKKDTYNTEKITIERLGNTYYTSVSQASPKAANNIGRGLTVACHRIDEFAFIKNIEITLPALLASASAARDSAAAHGAFYGNVFATTAGYLSSPEGRYAYKIYKEASRWDEHIFDCENLEHAIETIRKNSPGGNATVLCEYNHRQLGFTDEWLRQKIEDAMADGIKAEAEFLNIWPEGNESSPISKENLRILHESIISDPYTTVSKDGYITRWYISKDEIEGRAHSRKLVMGLDTSDAIGNDDIAMCIRDAVTGEVIATGIYNETNLITFANWLIEWVENYPNLTVIIERRSSGVTIIDNLLTILPTKGINPFRRLFNWVVHNAPENPKYQQELQYVDKYFDIDTINQYRKEFGYATSASGRASRDNLYGSSFTAAIKYTSNTARDRTLVDQLSSLVRKNDRIDHPDGGNDDIVISWMLGWFFLNSGKNLQYYGLNPQHVLLSVSDTELEEKGGREAIEYREQQTRLYNDVEAVLNMAKEATTSADKEQLIRRAKFMAKDLNAQSLNTLNLDAMLKNMNMTARRSIVPNLGF